MASVITSQEDGMARKKPRIHTASYKVPPFVPPKGVKMDRKGGRESQVKGICERINDARYIQFGFA